MLCQVFHGLSRNPTLSGERVGFRLSPWNTWQSMKMTDPVPQFAYFVEQLKQLKLAYLHVTASTKALATSRPNRARFGTLPPH
jgi:2,4-dienoyl-CoA reductase-like NADH-dependent reductase (Old Yellow Enzyme family)